MLSDENRSSGGRRPSMLRPPRACWIPPALPAQARHQNFSNGKMRPKSIICSSTSILRARSASNCGSGCGGRLHAAGDLHDGPRRQAIRQEANKVGCIACLHKPFQRN